MDNLGFELNKVKKEIQRHGEEYTFYRREKNEFGEASGEETEIKVLKGIFHEERGYVSLTTDDGANIRKKPEPQILCIIEYEKIGEDAEEGNGPEFEEGEEGESTETLKANVADAEVDGEEIPVDDGNSDASEPIFLMEIVQGDYVKIRGVKYKVVTVVDIQNYGIIANISLEMVV